MSRRSGMYKSNKRQKELKRIKKQEEKRLRRQRGAVKETDEHKNAETETDAGPLV